MNEHGRLPRWGVAPLPEAPAFTGRNVLRTVGPGVIGLGVAIGGGEWLLGPSVVVRYGATLLWITTLAVILQTVLNLEMARYTLYTGEPILIGFMRTRPGPGFWGWTYSLLSLLQYGWPGWALASATATAAIVLGRLPAEADKGVVIALGYLTFGACFALVFAGRKVERTLEHAMWLLMAWVFMYLLVMDLATVSASNWQRVFSGLTRPGRLPEGGDWLLLAAFAAYSGLGGMGNAYITHWMRDKGFGMGATVGFIPGARGRGVEVSPHGNVFPVDAGSLRAWRGWWRFLNVDQWGIFALGSIGGMALTAVLTLEYVPAGSAVGGWAVANLQAAAIERLHGRLHGVLAMLCGLWVLFSTQLGIVDGLPRSITDMLWSGSATVRRWRGGDIRAVYAVVLLVFAAWGCVALNLAQPLTLLVVGANIAALNLVFLSIHTLVLNRRVLPPELRPSRLRESGLLLCALFYGSFALATGLQLLH